MELVIAVLTLNVLVACMIQALIYVGANLKAKFLFRFIPITVILLTVFTLAILVVELYQINLVDQIRNTSVLSD